MGRLTLKSFFRQLFSITYVQEGRTSLSDVASNTSWLIVDKGINLAAGLLVGVWVARYLGTVQFGQFNYALSYVLLFSPIAVLGLNDLVVRNVVRDPGNENEILGTALGLQIVASLLALATPIVIAVIVFPDDVQLQQLVFILALGVAFQPLSNIISYWFQAQLLSKYEVLARNWALLLVSLAKIGLILFGASLIAFAWANTVRAIIFTVVIFTLYGKARKSIKTWTFDTNQAQILLKDSWPLIISGLAIMIYTRFDQIMLSNIIGAGGNGIYAAAVRLSEIWYFLPVALGASFFPVIVRTRETQKEKIYSERMQLFFDIMTMSTYIIVVPLSIFAPWLIRILYGSAYAGAGAILRVHIWAFLFVSLGVSRSRWLIAENLVGFTMTSTILGAVVNVGLNYILIPRYAGLGAAWATLISYAVSAYLSSLLFVRTWPAFKQQSLSILIPFRVQSFFRDFRETVMK